MAPKVCISCGSLETKATGGCLVAFATGVVIVFLSLMFYAVVWRNFLVVIAAVILACAYGAQQSRPSCAACGSRQLVPTDTPIGRKLTGA